MLLDRGELGWHMECCLDRGELGWHLPSIPYPYPTDSDVARWGQRQPARSSPVSHDCNEILQRDSAQLKRRRGLSRSVVEDVENVGVFVHKVPGTTRFCQHEDESGHSVLCENSVNTDKDGWDKILMSHVHAHFVVAKAGLH